VPHAWLLPGEAQIDTVQAMRALHDDAAAHWRWGRRVVGMAPGRLDLDDGSAPRFDAVFDLRGLGARPDLPVRGVRGETVWLHAPGHGLTRPLRLLHPRHRIYIAPRPCDVLVVGASEIESEDRSEVSLKTGVEMMTAAYSVLPALQEARILRLDRNLRPALPDNEPHVASRPGLVRINGLFRHGWLIAPALVDDALRGMDLA
jgi:glycine oxidase